jgi:hypothetical protein
VAKDILYRPLSRSKEEILSRIQFLLEPDSLEASDNISLPLQDFANGTVIAIIDGSYFPQHQKAAGAWILESRCRLQWIMGSMTCPGTASEFNSFRSELVGLLGSSITLYTLSLVCTQQPRGLIIGCDGDAALDVLSLLAEKINTNLNHWDLISIWKSMDSVPVKAYVKGHQDGCGRQLSRLEHMNVLMDGLAKNTALLRPSRRMLRNLENTGIPRVYYEDKVLVGHLQKSLYYTLTMERHMQYLIEK